MTVYIFCMPIPSHTYLEADFLDVIGTKVLKGLSYEIDFENVDEN